MVYHHPPIIPTKVAKVEQKAKDTTDKKPYLLERRYTHSEPCQPLLHNATSGAF